MNSSRDTIRLDELTAVEIAKAQQNQGKVTGVLLPVGSQEQHGPILPTGCDMAIARGAAEALARNLLGNENFQAFVLPDFSYTPAPGAEEMAGTVSVSFDWLGRGLKEILAAVSRSGWKFMAILNAHAFNHGRVIEASIKGNDGTLGRKIPVVVIHLYEFARFCLEAGLNPGSHAGEFEIALYQYYGRPINPKSTCPGPGNPRKRPPQIYGLDLEPRSNEGIIADAPPDVPLALARSQTLGGLVDDAIYNLLVDNLDTYFEFWS